MNIFPTIYIMIYQKNPGSRGFKCRSRGYREGGGGVKCRTSRGDGFKSRCIIYVYSFTGTVHDHLAERRGTPGSIPRACT